MQFERIRKNHKRKIIIGGLILVCVISAITITTTRAKYKLTEDTPLVRGTINYKEPDLRIMAVSISEDGINYNIVEEIPTSGYNFNSEKSVCKVAAETSGIENAPKDNNITMEYKDGKINFLGITKKGTRCYLYFDKERDTTKPTITNVTTSVTKTEINVSVTATDDKGVTEYWYRLDSNTPVKGTGNTYKFTGLSVGTMYSVKVYVKDAAGNQSDITTKSVQTTPNTASETILGNITVNSGTPNFANAATTDEGVFKANDGMYGGYSYYWRGAVTNNYVKFANKCWRIIRINGDDSMRLIYDGSSCRANGTSTTESSAVANQAYNLNYDRSEYVGYTYTTGSQRTLSGTASNLKTQNETWYNSNIGNNSIYSSKIADGKYCNDRNAASGYSWSSQPARYFYYGGYDRTNGNPTLSCASNDVYTLKVGAITMDEVIMAGGVYGKGNNSYYLSGGYWTMSPYNWSYNTSTNRFARVFCVRGDGELFAYNVDFTMSVRPVINLRSNVTFSSGNGTQSNPYVVA